MYENERNTGHSSAIGPEALKSIAITPRNLTVFFIKNTEGGGSGKEGRHGR